MDEALEAVELAADAGFGGVLKWILRVIGLVAVLAGVALLLVTEMLLIPVALLVVGLVLLVAPSVLLWIAELA